MNIQFSPWQIALLIIAAVIIFSLVSGINVSIRQVNRQRWFNRGRWIVRPDHDHSGDDNSGPRRRW